MLAFIDTVARRLVRRGLRKGLLEGNPVWLAVFAAALFVRLIARPQRPLVQRETLRLGETITVTHSRPPDRRGGRARSSASRR